MGVELLSCDEFIFLGLDVPQTIEDILTVDGQEVASNDAVNP